GTGTLGDAERDRAHRLASALRVRDVALDLTEVLAYRGHVAEIDRSRAARAHHHAAHLGGGGEGGADLDAVDLVGRGELAGLEPGVRPLECLRHLARGGPGRHEAGRLEGDADLPRPAAD